MSLDPQRIPLPARSVAHRVIDGKALLLDPTDDRILRLNDVGTFVWSLITQRRHTIAELIAHVVEEFEVDRETAEADVADFITKLEAGLFVIWRA